MFVDHKHQQNHVNKILYLQKKPNISARMGLNALKLAETKYDKYILCNEFVEAVHSLIPKIQK